MRWIDRLAEQTASQNMAGSRELPEWRIAERLISEQIRYRPKQLRLPHKDMRFRSLSEVALKTLVYFDLSPNGEALFPIPVFDYVVNPSIVLILPYEPQHTSTVGCRLIPETYDDIECQIVENWMRDDPNYLGYAFVVSYEQLHIDFEWLGEVEPKFDSRRIG